MAKSTGIKYNFSGKWDDVEAFLRNYSTDDVIKRINRESKKLLFESRKTGIPAAKHVNFNLYEKGRYLPQKQEVYIMEWALLDLAYYIIKVSNDYRGKTIEYDEELYMLQVAVDNYKEREEKDFVDNDTQGDKKDFYLYLWGFAGEQFKLQNPKSVFDNFSRDMYMLFEINDPCLFDMEKALYDEVGMTWDKVVSYLMLAWYGFTKVNTLQELIENMKWRTPNNKTEFEHVIKRYTTNYYEVRKSPLGRQILYAKPYVKTQKGEVVSVSAYLNLFLYEHCILWLIRDNFKKQNKQDFVNYFGELFEKYFNELLSSCLKDEEYERIIESDKDKRADWKLIIGQYKFLVEQKSTVLRLSAKQQQTDISAIKDFAKKTVFKALRQLENTEKDLMDGKYIKIILLYEDYLKPELLEQFINMPECDVKNDKYYWLVSIEEMEMLLNLLKFDRKKFDRIIKEKIERETNHSIAGKSLLQLLNENGIFKNEYIKQEKFTKYKKINKVSCD